MLNSNCISLSDVLKLLFERAGEAFSITFISLDFAKKTGGDIITLNDCIIPKRNKIVAEKISATENSTNFGRKRRNTIDILNRQNDKWYRVHIDLIKSFNNKEVVW